VFTRLVASAPARQRDTGGFLISTLLHGSVIAAAVLVTATKPFDQFIDEPRVIHIPLPPRTVEPMPARPRPVSERSAPVPLPPEPTFDIPVQAPPEIAATIPAPSEFPWVEPADQPKGDFTGRGSSSGTARDALPGLNGAFPEAYVDVPAALDAKSPLPRYPDGLRARRMEGAARLTFVVDTLGRVEMATVKVVESSHPAFAASVRSVLPRMRFRAARIGSRPVRQLVEFPITFRLEP
jgi:TonB family protein